MALNKCRYEFDIKLENLKTEHVADEMKVKEAKIQELEAKNIKLKVEIKTCKAEMKSVKINLDDKENEAFELRVKTEQKVKTHQ